MRNLSVFFLCLLLLSSCCVSVTTGDGLDAVGRQQPMIHRPLHEKPESLFSARGEDAKKLTVWKKGDLYYVELPVVYVPVNSPWISLNAPLNHRCYPAARSATELYEQQSKVQIFYAEVTDTLLTLAGESIGKHVPLYATKYRVLPADEVDLSGAKKVQSCVPVSQQYLFLNRLSDKCTPGNYLRRPLVWGLRVVDAPLTVAGSAVGLVFVALFD